MILHVLEWQFKNIDGGLYHSSLKDCIKGRYEKKKIENSL